MVTVAHYIIIGFENFTAQKACQLLSPDPVISQAVRSLCHFPVVHFPSTLRNRLRAPFASHSLVRYRK